jgi:hypothetical protein
MTFFSFYAQPSCTPGRAADADRPHPQPQRHDHRGLPGPGRRTASGGVDPGLGAEAGWLQDLLHRQVALGRGDYALPTAQGYDEMKYVGLYHLNAYTYGDPTWFPDMSPELREMFKK